MKVNTGAGHSPDSSDATVFQRIFNTGARSWSHGYAGGHSGWVDGILHRANTEGRDVVSSFDVFTGASVLVGGELDGFKHGHDEGTREPIRLDNVVLDSVWDEDGGRNDDVADSRKRLLSG